MLSEQGDYSRSHGISSELIKAQAEAIGIPIVQRKTTWESYEEEFKKNAHGVKKNRVLRQEYLEILIYRSTETGLKEFVARPE